jgi:hypothetical protein
MNDFQNRVVIEKNELDARLEKLKQFLLGELFKSLPADEQSRLIRQSEVMTEYSGILDGRIAAFASL